ncbi:unnamed protein product [Urochloa humidicola]
MPRPDPVGPQIDAGEFLVGFFWQEGRLFQVEYAIEAIKLGSTAVGLKTMDGVVLAVEKCVTSPLLICWNQVAWRKYGD